MPTDSIAIPQDSWNTVLFGLFALIISNAIFIGRAILIARQKREDLKAKTEFDIKQQIIEDGDFKNALIKQLQTETIEHRSFVQRQLAQKDEDIKLGREKTYALEQQINALQKEFDQARLEAALVPQLKQTQEKMQQQINQYGAEFKNIVEENTDLRKNLETRQVVVKEKQREIDKLKFDLKMANDEILEKNVQIEEMNRRIEHLEIEVKELREKIDNDIARHSTTVTTGSD